MSHKVQTVVKLLVLGCARIDIYGTWTDTHATQTDTYATRMDTYDLMSDKYITTARQNTHFKCSYYFFFETLCYAGSPQS